jgi:Domain of unknown function (DUF4416)
MTVPAPPQPVTLIVGMLSSRPELLRAAESELAALYGPVGLRSELIPFTFTGYYAREMGPDLKRQFLSFAEPIDPGRLAEIKLRTNALEQDAARREPFVARPINLDPGYVCGSKLVLASAKDRAQRIYLAAGIYAEITLDFHKGRFRPLETTYPDYRSAEYLDFFTRVRERHLARQA